MLANLVDRADIGMVQNRSSLRFAVEAAQCLCVWRKPVRKEFQGNKAVELGVLSFVDNAHSTAAEHF